LAAAAVCARIHREPTHVATDAAAGYADQGDAMEARQLIATYLEYFRARAIR
jgi:hypothetical protein